MSDVLDDELSVQDGTYYHLFDPTKRARAAIILFIVHGILQSISSYFSYNNLSEIKDILSGPVTQSDVVRIQEMSDGVLGQFSLLITIGVVIAFCMWLYKASENVHTLNLNPKLENSTGWTIGWFFIPIANLWKSFQAVGEVYQASRTIPNPEYRSNYKTAKFSKNINMWWLTYASQILMGLVILFMSVSMGAQIAANPSSIDGDAMLGLFENIAILTIVSTALMLISIYFVIQVILEITKLQTAPQKFEDDDEDEI